MANNPQVLIDDDNKDAADTMALLLQALGRNVSVSYNPFDALLLAKWTSLAVLFVDTGLPDIDRYELARRLRTLPEVARLLIVALPGYRQSQDKESTLQAGFDHHLVRVDIPAGNFLNVAVKVC